MFQDVTLSYGALPLRSKKEVPVVQTLEGLLDDAESNYSDDDEEDDLDAILLEGGNQQEDEIGAEIRDQDQMSEVGSGSDEEASGNFISAEAELDVVPDAMSSDDDAGILAASDVGAAIVQLDNDANEWSNADGWSDTDGDRQLDGDRVDTPLAATPLPATPLPVPAPATPLAPASPPPPPTPPASPPPPVSPTRKLSSIASQQELAAFKRRTIALSELTDKVCQSLILVVDREVKHILLTKSKSVDPSCMSVYLDGMTKLFKFLYEEHAHVDNFIRIEVLVDQQRKDKEHALAPPAQAAYIKVLALPQGPNRYVRLNTTAFGVVMEELALSILQGDSTVLWPFVRNKQGSYLSVSAVPLPVTDINFMSRFFAGMRRVNQTELAKDYAQIVARACQKKSKLKPDEIAAILTILGAAGDIYKAILRVLYCMALDTAAGSTKQFVYPNPRLMAMARDQDAPRKTAMHASAMAPTSVQVRYYLANPFLPPRQVHEHNKKIGNMGQGARQLTTRIRVEQNLNMTNDAPISSDDEPLPDLA